MMRPQLTAQTHDARHDARARVHAWGAAALSFAGIVVVLGTVATTKINPCRVPGGLPREGNS